MDGQPPSEVGAVECNFLKVIDQLFVHRINTLSPLRQRSLRFIMMQAVSQETGKGCRRHRPPVLPSEIGPRQKARTVRKVQENRSCSQKGTRNCLRDIVHSNSGSCGFPNSPMRVQQVPCHCSVANFRPSPAGRTGVVYQFDALGVGRALK